MRLIAQPGRRPGAPKCIYSQPLQVDDVQVGENGDVIISIIADDIYSKDSKQRYQIILTEGEMSLLGSSPAREFRQDDVSAKSTPNDGW